MIKPEQAAKIAAEYFVKIMSEIKEPIMTPKLEEIELNEKLVGNN